MLTEPLLEKRKITRAKSEASVWRTLNDFGAMQYAFKHKMREYYLSTTLEVI